MKVTFEQSTEEWTEGYMAGLYRESVMTCPYAAGTSEAEDWLAGHAKGMTGTIIGGNWKK